MAVYRYIFYSIRWIVQWTFNLVIAHIKCRYFNKNGWPTSTVLNGKVPSTDEEKVLLVDTLQTFKTGCYKDLILSGCAEARPGIINLLDQAQSQGIKTAICSAATKESVKLVVNQV